MHDSVEQATALLEGRFDIMINTAISEISTIDETGLSDLESRFATGIQELFRPIKTQLDYHLPPPPQP